MFFVLAGVVIIIVLFYFFAIKPLNYWNELGVPNKKTWPILGNMVPVILRTKSLIDIVQNSYNIFPDKRYYGMHQFMKPVLVLRDVDLIKQITVKDFDHFTDHNGFGSEDVDPLMARNLFSLKGQRWRDMRATLSPSFTGSKMRSMFVLLSEVAEQFTEHFLKQGTGIITVELKDIFTRFSNDAIASVAFGLKVDSLGERDNEFYLMGKEATTSSFIRTIKFILLNISPALMKYLNLTFISKTVTNFFKGIVKETIERREREGISRPDMIQLLMEAKKGHDNRKDSYHEDYDAGFAAIQESQIGKINKHPKLELSIDDITAQALIFFFGGFDTSATLMSLVIYELAVNKDVQNKLQQEIDATLRKCNGKISYEGVIVMKYLDMVVSEALRKWPPGFQIDRVCVKDYTITPTADEQPFTVKTGQLVVVPVIGIHRDPHFFPNPDKFDPERFNADNKHTIPPSSYMPFGSGPRSCIASRFALLENKILLFHLLSKFEVLPVKETVIPLKMGKKSFNLMPDGGFWLGMRRRNV